MRLRLVAPALILAVVAASLPASAARKGVRGVSRTEITVVLYNDFGVEGDLTKPWAAEDEEIGSQLGFSGQTTDLVRTLKAQRRYFQSRYQTYGRLVRVIAFPATNTGATRCTSRRTDATVAIRDFQPFAITVLGEDMSCFVSEASLLGVPTVGLLTDLPREAYFEHPGMVWSFSQDLSELATMSAGFICDKLVGRPARYSGDSRLQSEPRRFALLYPVESGQAPGLRIQAAELRDALQQRCGLTSSSDGSTGLIVEGFRENFGAEASTLMADFMLKGVSTVVCYCDTFAISRFQAAATSLAYLPEWYFDTASRMYRSTAHRRGTIQQQRSFGLTPEWLQGTIESGAAYKAFAQQAPNEPANLRYNSEIHLGFSMLYTAIQGAGARPTLATMQRGLKAYQLRVKNPRRVYGAFGVGDNPYTFQRSALAWSWDPNGQEPGHSAAVGCLRTAGHLSIDGRWRGGDADLDRIGTCMGPHVLGGPESRYF